MRKKIEELRNREEGFTLVELLAVIVILGIIVAIAIPAVGSVIDRAQKDADTQEEALVKDAARLYVTTNRKSLEAATTDGGFGPGWTAGTITTETLYGQGFLENREGDQLKGEVLVTRKETKEKAGNEAGSGVYTYTYTYKAVE